MISFSLIEENLAKDALIAALVSANRGAIERSSKWKSEIEFELTRAWYLFIPEKRNKEASKTRPKCARNFPPPMLLFFVVFFRERFPERLPRARVAVKIRK